MFRMSLTPRYDWAPGVDGNRNECHDRTVAPRTASVARPLVVRPFVAPDREAVIALLDSDPWRRLGYDREDWLRLLTTRLDGREGWVATTPNDVVGLALIRPRFLAGDCLELFAVAETARGKRCGATLLAHVEAVTFARGRNLFVCMSDFNGGTAVLRPPGVRPRRHAARPLGRGQRGAAAAEDRRSCTPALARTTSTGGRRR